MQRFNRNFEIIVGQRDPSLPPIVITPPFTAEIEVQRNNFSSANTASVRIYNLSQRLRDAIRKDDFDLTDQRSIEIKAGYGEQLATIALGTISVANSERQGVDFITTIESFDGGRAFGFGDVSLNFPSGTRQDQVYTGIIDALGPLGVRRGVISDFPETISRGNSYSGNATKILKDITDDQFFIDNGIANVIRRDEIPPGEIIEINSATGLLSTPKRENLYLTFDMLFEPRLMIGGQVRLDSVTLQTFNGFYKVFSINHRLQISESVNGTATTSVGLLGGRFEQLENLI